MNFDSIDIISKKDGLNELGFQEIELDNNLNHNCSYFEIEDFHSKIKNKREIFSTFSLNIRSLQNKMSEFQDLLDNLSSSSFSFSALCLQEIWNIPNAQSVLLDNFHPMALKTRNQKKGGGVGIYISKQFQFESLNELDIVNDQYEAIFLKVFKDRKDFKIICNIYRPPNGDLKQFIEFLSDKLDTFSTNPDLKRANEIILCADFNVNFMNFDTHSLTNDLLNTLISHGFLPMITLPSRITERSATLIDNIFTNKIQSFYDSGLLHSSISDHLPAFYLQTSFITNKSNDKTIYHDMSAQNINSFKEKLSNENWTLITQINQPTQAFDSFSKILDNHFMESFPLKEKRKNKRHNPIKPWMTDDILNLRKKHRKLLKEKFRKRTLDAKEKFDVVNKTYSKEVRKAKKVFYDAKFSSFNNDMKKTWSLINTIIKKKKAKNDVPKVFYDEHKTYNSFSEIAAGFNDFFVNVGPRLASSIPDSNKLFDNFLGDPHNVDFSFRNITEDVVYKTLSNLKSKNSIGKDKISMSLLKDIMPLIISPIIHLFNLSLNTGFIPDIYKCAKVIPVYKSGPPDQFDNYRPISLLPALSKVLEKIVSFQMIRFLETQNILYTHQYGFRKNRDTQQPLIQLLNKVYKGLNKSTSEYTLSVFLDLRKAFDTCNIDILIKKLNHYGFRGTSLKWFKNYLTGRKQYVELEGFKSNEQVITHGVPQGSVLGPILFLLYINDFPQATNLFSSLFADDTLLTKSMSDVKNLYDYANNELIKVSDWFKSNKLSLNVSKTKFMIFRNEKMPKVNDEFKLFIDNSEIERIGNDFDTKSFKFVGISLDEFLNWNQHIHNVNNKISSAIYALNQIRKILPEKTLKTIYNSILQPNLQYSIITWGNAKFKDLEPIILKQKKAVRFVSKSKYNAHCDPLFSQLNILKLQDLFQVSVSSFVSKFLHNQLPDSFNEIFQPLQSSRVKQLRSQIPKLKSLERFPNVSFPKIFNKLDENIRNCTSFKSTKKRMKKSIIKCYSNFKCTKRKCYPCKK